MTCGGCNSLGAHVHWCREVVGHEASVYGPLSERMEEAGDAIGWSDPGLSNRLYEVAAGLGEYARAESVLHQSAALTAATTAAFEATTPTEREARACDCDYWHGRHRSHCSTNFPTPTEREAD